jgi:O-antigen/teichoic acid export membrane protein
MGRQREVLNVVLVSTLAFHATALTLIPKLGASGANIAHLVMGAIWLAGMVMAFRKALATAPVPGPVQASKTEVEPFVE